MSAPTGDQAIRWSTIAAVSVVALVAAFVSYRHALQVVRLHGESGPLALAYPLTMDGLIYSASMVLLNAARQQARPPRLAYVALGLGIAATLAANVAAGLAYGPVGATVAAWPAVALVISYELLMLVIRRSAAIPDPVPGLEPVPAPVPEPRAELNGHGHQAAELFAAELAAGDVPSIRAIRAGLHVGQDRARQVQAHLETLTPAGRSIAQLRAELRQPGPAPLDAESGRAPEHRT